MPGGCLFLNEFLQVKKVLHLHFVGAAQRSIHLPSTYRQRHANTRVVKKVDYVLMSSPSRRSLRIWEDSNFYPCCLYSLLTSFPCAALCCSFFHLIFINTHLVSVGMAILIPVSLALGATKYSSYLFQVKRPVSASETLGYIFVLSSSLR